MAKNPARGAIDFPFPAPPTGQKGGDEVMQAEPYPTESALLSGAAGGDPDAVRALIDSVGPVVYGFVFARVGGDEPAAQDLLQETLIEALRSAPTFRGDASLRTWVCAIARRRLARHYEAERRQAVAESGLAILGGIGGLAGAPAGERDAVERRDEIVCPPCTARCW
jgi:RNA polymerase sigma-70 factor (ECF subfamily)